jgi:hypothetical protein
MIHNLSICTIPNFKLKMQGSNMLSFIAVLVMFVQTQAYVSPRDIYMGTAAHYGVIAQETITSTGYTRLNGDLALYQGTSVTGFPPAICTGEMNIADSQALQAKEDLDAGSVDAESRVYDQLLNGDAGGMTLAPGVYRSTSSLAVSGDLKLDCQGVINPIWIFQIVSTLTLSTGSVVAYINCLEGTNPHAYWNVGSSATLETTSTIVGTVMSYASITAQTGATTGALLARTASVTLDTNEIVTPQYSLTTDPNASTQSAGNGNGASTQGGKAGIAIACIVVFLAAVGAVYYVTMIRGADVESASAKQNPVAERPAAEKEKKARFEAVSTEDGAENAENNV